MIDANNEVVEQQSSPGLGIDNPYASLSFYGFDITDKLPYDLQSIYYDMDDKIAPKAVTWEIPQQALEKQYMSDWEGVSFKAEGNPTKKSISLSTTLRPVGAADALEAIKTRAERYFPIPEFGSVTLEKGQNSLPDRLIVKNDKGQQVILVTGPQGVQMSMEVSASSYSQKKRANEDMRFMLGVAAEILGPKKNEKIATPVDAHATVLPEHLMEEVPLITVLPQEKGYAFSFSPQLETQVAQPEPLELLLSSENEDDTTAPSIVLLSTHNAFFDSGDSLVNETTVSARMHMPDNSMGNRFVQQIDKVMDILQAHKNIQAIPILSQTDHEVNQLEVNWTSEDKGKAVTTIRINVSGPDLYMYGTSRDSGNSTVNLIKALFANLQAASTIFESNPPLKAMRQEKK